MNPAVVEGIYHLQLGLVVVWTQYPSEHTNFLFFSEVMLCCVLKLRKLACGCLFCLYQAALESEEKYTET